MDSIAVKIGSKKWEFTPNEAHIVQRELAKVLKGQPIAKNLRKKKLGKVLMYDDFYNLLEPLYPDPKHRQRRAARLFAAMIRVTWNFGKEPLLDYFIICAICDRHIKEPCTVPSQLGWHNIEPRFPNLSVKMSVLKKNAQAFETSDFPRIGPAAREDMRHIVESI